MTIASEIIRIKTAVANAYTACQEMGATMPAVLNSDNLEQCIASISGGQPAKRGRFVAASAAKIAYSDDGLTWTEIENTNEENLLVYGNGVFIKYKYGNNNYSYSNDGNTWIATSISSTSIGGNLGSIRYANGIFIAKKSDYTSKYAYSDDGINWTTGNFPDTVSSSSYSTSDSFYQLYTNNQGGYVSKDGINWSTFYLTGRTDTNVNAFTKGQDDYICNVVYSSESYTSSKYLRSTDGINWNIYSLPLSASWSGIFFKNIYVLCTHSTTTYLYSTDSINWNQGILPSEAGAKACSDDLLIVFGRSATNPSTYNYSYDGINWQSGNLPSSQPWYTLTYGEV